MMKKSILKFIRSAVVCSSVFNLFSCGGFMVNNQDSELENFILAGDVTGPGTFNKVHSSLEKNKRIISFSGYNWIVRKTLSEMGPGPNIFSNHSENVYVDEKGMLHLKISKRDWKWFCSSISNYQSLGYGRYTFEVKSPLENLPENVVLGLFTWDEDTSFNNREINIEFSRWGKKTSSFNSQFVVQPYEKPENVRTFSSKNVGEFSSHTFTWTKDTVSFESSVIINSEKMPVKSWTYSGPDIPPSGNEKVLINLWNFAGSIPSGEVELIIKKFEFTPMSELEKQNNLSLKNSYSGT